jgi:Divergent InlB B-repeat domain
VKGHVRAAHEGPTLNAGGSRRYSGRMATAHATSREANGSGAPSHRRIRLAMLFALVALCAMALAPAAQAAPSHAELPGLSKIGATGKGDLTLGSKDILNVTTATGAFEVGQSISGPGITGSARIVKVGVGTLEISIAATETKVEADLTAGSFQNACGVTIDSFGNYYVSSTSVFETSRVRIFDPTGTRITEFDTSEACNLAVDASGRVYITPPGTTPGAITRYSPSEFPPVTTTTYSVDTTLNGTGKLVTTGGASVAVNPSNGNVLASEQFNEVDSVTRTTSGGTLGGTYRLCKKKEPFSECTAGLAPSASGGTVKTALETVYGLGNIASVSGVGAGARVVTFGGALAGKNIEMFCDAELLTPAGSTCASTTTSEGGSRISSYESNGTLVSNTIGTGVAGAVYYGVDVYGANGRIYAVDTAHNNAYIFNPAGTVVLSTITGAEAPGGPFAEMSRATLAVDQANGNVLISDIKAHGVVDEFNAAGKFVDQITHSPAFTEATPADIAVDNSGTANKGNVYVSSGTGPAGKLYAFDTLEPKHTLAVAITPPGSGTVKCNGIACTSEYAEGSSITLEANPESGFVFKEWKSGTGTATACNSSTSPTCTIEITANSTVTAEFKTAGEALTITKDGSGTGTVECEVNSGPAGACLATYPNGTNVKLKVTPDPGSEFKSFAGDCTGAGPCELVMNADKSVTATFDLEQHTLTVTKNGSGTGTVTSSPAGISCDPTCSAPFNHGASVTLTGAPGTNTKPVTWTGCDSVNGSNQCIVAITAAKAVTATFDLEQHTLTVTKNGSGTGTVTSSPAGISCDPTCSAPFNHGASVTLTGAPGANTKPATWTGCDSVNGSNQCIVAITAAKAVTATFALEQHLLTVTKSGTGTGTVTTSPAGITCGATCSANFDHNAIVTLSKAADPGSVFKEWTGACTGSGTCEVTMSEAKSVNAEFSLLQRNLTVNISGTGTGSVTCDTGSGPGACAPSYPDGTTITLAQTPGAHSSFGGWSGCSSEVGGKCVVSSISANKTITATFTAISRTLTISKAGSGSVSCNGGNCTTSYAEGAVVTLTATPAAGSTFAGWSGGGCSGAGNCVVTMNADTAVTATFALIPPLQEEKGKVEIPPTASVSGGKASLKLTCLGGACAGKLKLTAKVKQGKKTKKVVIGQASFSLAAGESKTIKVKLSSAAKKMLNEGKQLKATLSGPGVKDTVKLKPSGGKK